MGKENMRPTKRLLALGLAIALLAACSHKDKDAPLAFVPADTPYVFANLEAPSDDVRDAMMAQADLQMPGQLQQMKTLADDQETKGHKDNANLLRAFVKELDGKKVEDFAKSIGTDPKGLFAFYGEGLSPVARVQIADPAAFNAFIDRMETAYGKKFDTAKLGEQSYRKSVLAGSGTEVVLAVVDKQAVAALLPADAAEPLLRQVLGLDRPDKSLQADGGLEKLAKDKGYGNYAVAHVDFVRMLPLIASGKDPLFASLVKQKMTADAAKTGEPVATQANAFPPSCQTEAARIAARVPSLSFGYTKFDTKHQESRFDVALAPDITQAFSGLEVETPGLGKDAEAPFEMTFALPMEQLRGFWSAQADAVAAKPFECPALVSLNEGFAKIAPAMQQAAIPPFGDIRGLRIVLDTFAMPAQGSQVPAITGRILLATRNPAGLLAMGQAFMPAIAQVKLANDGKPVALPTQMTAMVGQSGWAAMNDKAIAIGVGAGEDAKLADMLKDATGDKGRMLRMHFNGDMYRSWIDLLADRAASVADTAMDDPTVDPAVAAKTRADSAARSKAQFDAMRAQAQRIVSAGGEMHVDADGVTVTGKSELK
jgi:hypothetical protein